MSLLPKTVLVWDIFIRVFHWALVGAFTLAYLTGDEVMSIHIYAGYVVLGLVTFRLIYGLIGTRYARFSEFVRGPADVIAHLKSMLARHPRHYLGHNPAAGAMVVALLLSLAVTGVSGLKALAEEGRGPLAEMSIGLMSAAYADSDQGHNKKHEGDELWEEIHEVAGNLSLLLVVLHIAGVLVSCRFEGQNLVRSMVTGRKAMTDVTAE